MNKLLFLFFFSTHTCFGQINDSLASVCDSVCDSVYAFVDEEAEFPGGMVEMKKYIFKNIEWSGPDVNLKGTIFLQFIVRQNGTVVKAHVLKGVNTDMDKMAIDLIQKMPNWTPAKINGVPVCSEIRLPISIHLN